MLRLHKLMFSKKSGKYAFIWCQSSSVSKALLYLYSMKMRKEFFSVRKKKKMLKKFPEFLRIFFFFSGNFFLLTFFFSMLPWNFAKNREMCFVLWKILLEKKIFSCSGFMLWVFMFLCFIFFVVVVMLCAPSIAFII